MPVEINELIIRTAITEAGPRPSSLQGNGEWPRQEWVTTAVRKATDETLRKLKRKNER